MDGEDFNARLTAAQAKRARRNALYEREVADWTDAELAEVLAERYEPTAVPPCRVCGGPLSVQRIGGGSPTTWACDGLKAEEDRKTGESLYRDGRLPADEHYSRSQFEDRRQGGDAAVMELLRRFQSAPAPGARGGGGAP